MPGPVAWCEMSSCGLPWGAANSESHSQIFIEGFEALARSGTRTTTSPVTLLHVLPKTAPPHLYCTAALCGTFDNMRGPSPALSHKHCVLVRPGGCVAISQLLIPTVVSHRSLPQRTGLPKCRQSYSWCACTAEPAASRSLASCAIDWSHIIASSHNHPITSMALFGCMCAASLKLSAWHVYWHGVGGQISRSVWVCPLRFRGTCDRAVCFHERRNRLMIRT
ncbi:hypothetical protein EJ03DRAFT_209568 [Teratosphaeria nubilosa]|uniref:Uncharacterized protein n=1 Tax=Teratosphaeria nubilosa TaxID=161662 RepID=A0A6G1KXJ9_9PEZI|nr:hypothetical protein EJ03DRAFT_209568 [Teratosphaeria nubilosa]